MRNGNFRDFPGRVALIAVLRIGHVAGVVGVGAAVLLGRMPSGAFLFLLVACGAGIALLDAYANRAYFRQASGLAVLLKAALLALLAAFAVFGAAAFWGFLIFSVAIAHAPGRLRHRKVI
ncbi:MAG: hypothetical protein PHY45_07745 [Rhodocyclaceae bacterium]|nr:hypothetical protein [Rhodocyclaceae bacterium]